MIRKIIKIDREKCVGCGLCVNACQEGAIGLTDGKAVLLRDDCCDGLGNCLPLCPTGAISFEHREAAALQNKGQEMAAGLPCSCPGSEARAIRAQSLPSQGLPAAISQLKQWPVQIKLASANAPYFTDAHLLIAADCAAYAYGNFHADFMKDRITLIGCPKLDAVDYSEKLSQILATGGVSSVTVTRMAVPCCVGIEHATKTALKTSTKHIPCRMVTIAMDGSLTE